MKQRIILFDPDHPSEPFEAHVLARDETALHLAVPRTRVRFSLAKARRGEFYEGELGGRRYRWMAQRGGGAPKAG